MSRSGSREINNFRGLNASIFVIFSINTPKILRGVHLFALECPKKKCKQRTVCIPMRMNTERVGAHSRQYKQEIVPF